MITTAATAINDIACRRGFSVGAITVGAATASVIWRSGLVEAPFVDTSATIAVGWFDDVAVFLLGIPYAFPDGRASMKS